jgi:dipeptide/tripeptide permease
LARRRFDGISGRQASHSFAANPMTQLLHLQSQSKRRGRHYIKLALVFIVLNALVWWVLFSEGPSSLDTYSDMAEAYSWGISWQLG